MPAQRRVLVAGGAQAATAQLRHHRLDDRVEIDRQHRGQDVEAVAGARCVPLGEPAGELIGRADEAYAAGPAFARQAIEFRGAHLRRRLLLGEDRHHANDET